MMVAKRKSGSLPQAANEKAAPISEDEDGRENRTNRMKRRKTNIVSTTNALSCNEFCSAHVPQGILVHPLQPPSACNEHSKQSVTLRFFYAQDLSDIVLRSCFALIEGTSKSDYEASSIGWHPKQKIKEMKQPDMRYLIASRQQGPRPHLAQELGPTAEVEGFLSFMITHEDGLAVLYVYEIHLTPNARGRGLGKHLMLVVEEIARSIGGLEKVMLTCFVSNASARAFYAQMGYAIDENSPADRNMRGKILKADYVIMSRRVALSDARRGQRDV